MNPRESSTRPIHWYGDSVKDGIPHMHNLKIRGRLVVIEGPDASGRSTQIDLITAKLEADGYAVLNTGLNRSELISRGILEAKRNVSLGRRTLALYYAADFADQLEHKIIPALQAGYIVLADRYIFTLMGRNTVRGIPRTWSHDLYSYALVPDMVFYIDVDPYKLVHRVFQKHRYLDYYESGADMALADDMFESFIIYQKKMRSEFEIMRSKYGLIHIDGGQGIEDVNRTIQARLDAFLEKYG